MFARGQVAIFAFMLGLVVIILALALVPVIKQSTDNARNATSGDTLGLDCSNSSISMFDKGACLTTDLTQPYFFGTLIAIGGAILAAKFFGLI
jgi:hypothetical protein